MVIAIIAILAALQLPALAGVKKRAQMATDINNCKQIMLGVMMYAANSDDYMPQPGWSTTLPFPVWAAGANMPLAPGGSGDINTYHNIYPQQVQSFQKGRLCRYVVTEKNLRCPAEVLNSQFFMRQQYLSSYIWNGGVVRCQNNTPTMRLNASEFKGSCILQWENDETTTQYGQWNDFFNFPDGSISRRHGDGAMVATLDGGAQRMDMRDVCNLAGNAANPTAGDNAADCGTAVAAPPNELWWFHPS